MKNKKEKDYEPQVAVWLLFGSFLGVCALVSIGISALAINFNL